MLFFVSSGHTLRLQRQVDDIQLVVILVALHPAYRT